MQKRIVLSLLIILSIYFAGACATISGNAALDGTTYTSIGPNCMVINIGGAPTNVFIDLHGSTITGATSNSSGINIVRNAETSVTIENGTISNSYYAVSLNGISVTLRNITILNSGYGIYVNSSSENNTIANITINNSDIGLYTLGLNSSMTNITITNSTRGILINSANNTLRNITITNTYYSFGVEPVSAGVCKSVADMYNNIDNSTLVDGKPIYYIHSAANTVNNLVIGRNLANFGDPAAIYIINGTNITVENITSQFMERAVVVSWGNNITFSNITINETYKMMDICDAHNVTIKDSTIGAYGTGYYDALPFYCEGGNCLVTGITLTNANNTNITRSKIKDAYNAILYAGYTYGSSITNNTIIGSFGDAVTFLGYNSIINYNNITYSAWETRPADTKRTNYTLLAPITGGTCITYGCYKKGLGINGQNITVNGNRIYNTTVGLYAQNFYNSTIHNLYVYNSSDGVAFEDSANLTLNYSTIINGYFTGYKKVDFRSLGTTAFNNSLYNVTFSSTRISMDFTGNVSINSSINLSASPIVGGISVGDYAGAAVNITNESFATANLTIYYPSGYNSMSVFRHPGNDTANWWVNVSDDPGVSYSYDHSFAYFKILNITNFSIFAVFGTASTAPVPVIPDSEGRPAPTKSELSLSISKTCPGGDIVISSEKGASITIMYPNGWSDNGKVGDSGSITFPKRGEGKVTVLGTHSDYSAIEKTYDYTNCPTPSLSVSSSYSCSENTVTYTVTSDGTIVGEASVVITNSDGASRSGITGADGKISFPIGLGQTYQIVVTKENYNTYRNSETYSLCPLTASGSLKCPEKTFTVIVTSNGQITSEALVEYDGVSSTDASGMAVFTAFNGTKSLIVTKNGYQTFETEVIFDSPCYTNIEPEEKPETKPGEEKPGTTTGDTTGTTTGTTTGQTKPSSVAGSIEETVKNSLDRLKDAVVELTDSNEKKVAAIVILIIAGFLAYNYFIPKKKSFKPKIVKEED